MFQKSPRLARQKTGYFSGVKLNLMKRGIPQSAVLVWFRNDLRMNDNKALKEAFDYVKSSQHSGKRILCLYVISEEEIKRNRIGYAKMDFVLRTLGVLKSSLKVIDAPLSILTLAEGKDSKEYGKLISSFCHANDIDAVFFNKEAEPIAQARDEVVKKHLDSEGICYRDFNDQCVVEEGLILTKQGKPYGMFTPFKNTWIAHLKNKSVEIISEFDIEKTNKMESIDYEIKLPLEDLNLQSTRKEFPAGEVEALKRLNTFLNSTGPKYDETRNFPATSGTSKLSPYLAVGAISPRVAVEYTRRANHGKLDSGASGLVSFISELCWRDFYRHILYHFPHVARGESFKPEAKKIQWREGADADVDFQAWASGKTGVPIVDAAIMQLRTTGWMHNRLRMIVSMYLTKHLLITWKKGEAFFASHLIDYDFPSNNGGWQWSSSTGTDSQPYFRIFNPYTQSENYDKHGKFIKSFLPDLVNVPEDAIHNPNSLLKPQEKLKLCPGYPPTLVEHTFARNRALEVFKRAFMKS